VTADESDDPLIYVELSPRGGAEPFLVVVSDGEPRAVTSVGHYATREVAQEVADYLHGLCQSMRHRQVAGSN